MARVSLWKLRRLAPRAKRVIERRKSDAPVISAYENTLTPAADQYMAAYDRATQMRGSWKLETRERQEAVSALAVSLQCWSPLVIRDVKSFDNGAFLQTNVPDDIIHDAEYIVALTIEHAGRAGAPLPYQDPLIIEMNDRLISARKEHTEAEAADKDYQQCLADVRAKAETFQTELTTFRRTLAALLGRSDKDYQKLRLERASHQDTDDDPAAPTPPDDDEELPGTIG
ncbi:MAG TPA: hypothetical protein VNM90_05685 [Haliangium sp.]|nr:hypothetical protein [Haliangium sp.]